LFAAGYEFEGRAFELLWVYHSSPFYLALERRYQADGGLFCGWFANAVAEAFSNISLAASDRAVVRARYFSRMHVADSRLWPMMAAIIGTLNLALASSVGAALTFGR
jgi:hypothetical protein